MRRYCDWDEAKKGHQELTRKIHQLIKFRFDVIDFKTFEGVTHKKVIDVHYSLRIGGYVKLTKDDLRMIRED